MKTVTEVILTNTKHNHNKIYFAYLQKNSTEWTILCRWGKIGGKLNSNQKGPYDTEAKAQKAFNALIAAKRSDGYLEDEEPESSEELLFYPQKAAEGKPEEVEAMLDDPLVIAEEKYDGSRYFAKKFSDGSLRFHSRKVSVKNNLPVDKTENVPHLVDAIGKALKDVGPTVLDHELLWSHGSVISVMGSLPERAQALQKEKGPVRMVIYDMPYFDGKSLFETPYEQRRAMLAKLPLEIPGLIKIAPQHRKNKREFLQRIWSSDGEGIILKDPQGFYYPGERPKGVWVKIKKKLTDEFVVMGFIDGKGKYKGQVGAIVFGQFDKYGKLVEVSQCSGFTDEERAAITKSPLKYVTRVLEVEFQQRTEKAAGRRDVESLRHPRFFRWRDDKVATDCKLPD